MNNDETKENRQADGVEPDSVKKSAPSAAAVPTPQPVPVYIPAPAPLDKPRRSFFRRVLRFLFILVFFCSIIMNLYLLSVVGFREHVYRVGNPSEKIALINVEGIVDMKMAKEMRSMLSRAAGDDAVKGVILVVNSPGGQVAPSAMIHKYISDFKGQTGKKVYVSIQQLGASGAYWIAAATDKIYAQTNAMVGSIGVIYINLVLEDTLEKIGIAPVVIKSSKSPFKDRGSPFRAPTEAERAEIERDIDTVHQRFAEVVSDGRGLEMQDVWKLANGDVFDGPEAKSNGLADEVGFLDDAIDDLADTLGMKKPAVVRFAVPPTIREMITAGAAGMDNPLDIEKQFEKWATTSRIQVMWLGR